MKILILVMASIIIAEFIYILHIKKKYQICAQSLQKLFAM